MDLPLMSRSRRSRRLRGWLLTSFVLAAHGTAIAAPPRITSLVPPAGERAADTTLSRIELQFDQRMAPSVTIHSDDMPEITGTPSWDSSRTRLRIPVRLQSGHWYQMFVNTPDDGGFQNLAGEPLAPMRWEFRTAGGHDHDDLATPGLAARLADAKVERLLGNGHLRLSHVYRLEAQVLLETHGQPESVTVARMIERVYRPYEGFWRGYVGDESRFAEFVRTRLLFPSHPIRSRLMAVLDLDLDSLFAVNEAWATRTLGQHPQGHWVLVFGTGATDMGGLSKDYMLADFTQQAADPARVQAILPHELTHMVHGQRAADPDGDTVLGRVISEGLACYAAYAHSRGARGEASGATLDSSDWQAGLAKERELVAALEPILGSRERADLDRVASHAERLLPDGPVAAGYFVGFRIVQSYVARHGRDSWSRLVRMPVREVVRKSGYPMRLDSPRG